MRRRWILGLALGALLLAVASIWTLIENNRTIVLRNAAGEIVATLQRPLEHHVNPPHKDDYLPQLDGILRDLVKEYARIGPEAINKFALVRGPEGDTVRVTIYGHEGPANLAELTQALRERGISADSPTENCRGTDFCVHVYVPLAHLLEISQLPTVAYMNVVFPFLPAQGGTVSEAVRAHGAETWQVAGYTGQGIEVGIRSAIRA